MLKTLIILSFSNFFGYIKDNNVDKLQEDNNEESDIIILNCLAMLKKLFCSKCNCIDCFEKLKLIGSFLLHVVWCHELV